MGYSHLLEVDDSDVADEVSDEEAVVVSKGKRKKVTFSLGSAKDKGKGIAVEEEDEPDEEDDIEIDDEEGDYVEEDVVDEAVEMAVNVGKSTLKKKGVGKPVEVTAEHPLEPKALKMIQRRTEVGEGSNKRKRDETAMVLVKKKKEVDGHGSPRQLFKLIGMLTESQKKDVEDNGFGGLLELKTHAFYHQMVDWLMQAKNDPELVKVWRDRFKLSFDAVRQEMLGLPDGGADFKKLFVVFAMGTFLAPTVHNRIDFRLVKAVENVDAISRLDWCSFVLLRLNAALDSWRTQNTKNVGGCLMFLQLMYFHRLTWWGFPESTTLPLVQHWTYERMKERMAQEVAAYRHHQGFGIGVWELPSYPVSRHLPKRLYRRPNENEPASRNPPVRFVQLPLPDGVPTDEELQATFYDVRVRNWMTTRRNLSVVNVIHKRLMRELGGQEDAGWCRSSVK
ncbi:uncharacterized protein LOC141587903 [Silene latifolia]|uniref:uncharacterized protein LOC141587903 n=1 Tax=Silene latifolia TaxID=37657 RepID=UPI003D77A4FA